MKKNVNRRRRRRGFTLMEILLVLAILVVLGSLVTVSYVQLQKSSLIKASKTQVKMLSDAVEAYRLDVGKYPSGAQGLEALRVQPPDGPAKKWQGPYIKVEIPLDPWNNPYVYEEITDQFNDASFQITSSGPDGATGTNDDISSPK